MSRYSQSKRTLLFENLEARRMLASVAVNDDSDDVDGDLTNGITSLKLSPGGDGISLREAILAANFDTAADTITFDPNVFADDGIKQTITLSHSAGQLNISESVTIVGPGSGELEIDASGLDADSGVIQGDGSSHITGVRNL